MIEIIDYGNKQARHRIKFRCRWCGCVFIADEADYKQIEYIYEISCPLCNHHIVKDKEGVIFYDEM